MLEYLKLNFEHPYNWAYLLLLVLLIIIALRLFIWQTKTVKLLGGKQVLNSLTQTKTFFWIRSLKAILVLFSIALIIIALALPRKKGADLEVKLSGNDIVFCLDVSNSMLAEDLSPSRLAKAKQFITSFVDNLKGDKVGLVTFAGAAALEVPPTSDYESFLTLLNLSGPNSIPYQGTNIKDAVKIAGSTFNLDELRNKMLVVITDGENHEGDALKEIEKLYEDKRIITHAFGIGSTTGAEIPVFDADEKVDVKRDENGNKVSTKLNPTLIKKIAQAGHGIWQIASNSSSGANDFLAELTKLNASEKKTKVFQNFEYYFVPFVLLAFILLAIEPLFKFSFRFNMKAKKLISILLLFPIIAFSQKENRPIREGNSLYKSKKYNEAIVEYNKALKENKNSYTAKYNSGNAAYEAGKFAEAEKFFEEAEKSTNDPIKKGKANYNKGNAQLQQQKNKEAIESYKEALKNNPMDDDSRNNLEYAKQAKKQGNNGNSNGNNPQNNNGEGDKPKHKALSKEEAEKLLKEAQDNENSQRKSGKQGHGNKNASKSKDW